MRQLTAIKKFCDGSAELYLRKHNRISRGKFSVDKFIDPNDTEVHRSLWFTDPKKFLFVLDIDFHDKPLFDAVRFSLAIAQHIDKNYPEQFLWKFSGKGIHGITLMNSDETPELSYYQNKYTDIQIMKAMAQNISKNLTGIDDQIYHSRATIRSLGSINLKRQAMWSVPIKLDWDLTKILNYAKHGKIIDWEIPVFSRGLPVEGITKTTPNYGTYPYSNTKNNYSSKQYTGVIGVEKFPPCILLLLSDPNLNYRKRVLLIPFLRDSGYSIKQIYEMFEKQFGKEKTEHITQGREVERFFEAGYKTPSCKYIRENGWCPSFCGLYSPLQPITTLEEILDD